MNNNLKSASQLRRRLTVLSACLAVSAIGVACSGGGSTRQETTGVGAQSTPSTATVPAPPDQGSGYQDVKDFQLVDDLHGWIAHGSAVSATDDGGRTWRDMKLPSGTGAVFFFDAARGVTVTNDPPAQSATPWFTNNGGATFTKGSTWQAAAPVMSMDGDLTGDGYYRLLVRYESGSGFNVGDLERN